MIHWSTSRAIIACTFLVSLSGCIVNANFSATEQDVRDGVNNFFSRKCRSAAGWFWDDYDSTQSERDAETIKQAIREEALNDPSNSKIVYIPQTRYDADKINREIDAKTFYVLRKIIIQRVQTIDSTFASEAKDIANTILRNFDVDHIREFIGDNLSNKVRAEMKKIRNEQQNIEDEVRRRNEQAAYAANLRAQQRAQEEERLRRAQEEERQRQARAAAAQASAPAAPTGLAGIKKLFTSEECCVCLEKFATLGKRRYINPCGHDICPDCHKNWSNEGKNTCPQCRGPLNGFVDVNVQQDHNPEIDVAG